MKISLSVFIIMLFTYSLSAQVQNVTLLGAQNKYPSVGYNDCWGYVDAQGREYALLGVQSGTSIVNVTNPAQPVEVAFIPGPFSLWRDIKTHSHFAYVVTEGTGTGEGLQIIDLSQLPNTAALVNTVSTYFSRAHNLYIDAGYAYVVGTDVGGGMHVLDLSNPINPVQTANYLSSGYVHDVYVFNDTAYASSEDTYDMVYLGSKSNPVKINSSAALPGIYAHSGWLSEDRRYFIACEEGNVRDITVWDLQSRNWDLVVPQWSMASGGPVHNVFVRGHFAYVAYYIEGLVVLDISDPANPEKVGHYDTFPGSGYFDGAWGTYPYLPSGNVIISDMSTGLYMVDFLLDPVPVELISFTGHVINTSVLLEWATSTESNNRGFIIERSSDKMNWAEMGFIAGYGTTSEPQNYSFTDENPFGNISYYRLRQLDFDGSEKLLPEIEVCVSPQEFTLEQNYPNPFNPVTTIKYSIPQDGQVSLKIFDVIGNEVAVLVNENKTAGNYENTFSADGLTSGVYFAKLESKNISKNVKMLLMK